jgi:flagellum-specific ATP synthase
VLVEGDDPNDPIGDSARSILDGHLVLARRLADRGHFPALDVGASVSRVMAAVVPREQLLCAQRFKQLYNRLEESRDIIAIGGYRPGNDAELDRAVALQPAIGAFLCQDMTNVVRFADSVAALDEIVA